MPRGEKTKSLWQNPEYRKHMSEIHKGYKATEETRKKMSVIRKGQKPMLGKKHSEETKLKMSNAHKGKKASSQSRKKMSQALKQMYRNGRIPWNKNMKGFNKGKLAGAKHPLWKGGITKDTNKYAREYALKRRHKLGINKRYIAKYSDSKISKKEIKKRNNQAYKRRVRMGGRLTIKTIQQVYEDNIKYYGTLTCYLCFNPILFSKDQLEHKIPLSRGGTNAKDNLDIACQKCNYKKHDKTEEEYRKESCNV